MRSPNFYRTEPYWVHKNPTAEVFVLVRAECAVELIVAEVKVANTLSTTGTALEPRRTLPRF